MSIAGACLSIAAVTLLADTPLPRATPTLGQLMAEADLVAVVTIRDAEWGNASAIYQGDIQRSFKGAGGVVCFESPYGNYALADTYVVILKATGKAVGDCTSRSRDGKLATGVSTSDPLYVSLVQTPIPVEAVGALWGGEPVVFVSPQVVLPSTLAAKPLEGVDRQGWVWLPVSQFESELVRIVGKPHAKP